MQVFISYDARAAQLSHQLKDRLDDNGISCYLYDLEAKYDSSLYQKITDAINDSQALIAIITEGQNSASVHEEIGYSIAKSKSVIIMLEEGADDGVLSHEREKEPFTREDFDSRIHRIIEYLKNIDNGNTVQLETTSTNFPKMRNLDPTSSNFLQNQNSDRLENIMAKSARSSNPLVLFFSCPVRLLNDVNITSSEYRSWLKNFQKISVEGIDIPFYGHNEKIGFEKMTYYNGDANKFSNYLEICSNGFIEQGFTQPLLYQYSGEHPVLHSCWLAGAFCAFLTFCGKHYAKFEYEDEIDICLSIRDAQELALVGFGGKNENGNTWADPYGHDWGDSVPSTDEPNLQMPLRLQVSDLSEERIKAITRVFSDKIANAYGLDFALCYNYDTTLNRDLLGAYNMAYSRSPHRWM